jgi:nicotinate-nucleotide adenylyltransferase
LRLALFGGTFDPIHHAHLLLAGEAADQFRLDRVLFVPASRPPHKSGATHADYAHRVRMVELACATEPRFMVSRLEEHTERSYSIDTIEKLRSTLYPADELFFLIGADAFAEIETWHRWRDVVSCVTFIVASRPGHEFRIPVGARVERIETLALTVSSSGIREALAAGDRPPELPPQVLEYIFRHRLYGIPGTAC